MLNYISQMFIYIILLVIVLIYFIYVTTYQPDRITKIKWDETLNETYFTYSKDEYDRKYSEVKKKEKMEISPFSYGYMSQYM